MLGHLGALVPGQRTPKFLRQGYDGARDRIANSLGAMSRESWSILGSRNVAMTVQSRQMQKHREARRSLDERAYCRTAEPNNEIALPVPRNRSLIGLGRALADHDLGRHEAFAALAHAGPRRSQRPSGAQARRQFSPQCASALDEERLVNGFVADPHVLVIREVYRQTPGDLLRTSRPCSIGEPFVGRDGVPSKAPKASNDSAVRNRDRSS